MTSPLKPIVHEAEFQIRTYDIDSRKMATLPALVRLMQEAAMEQVIKLGISVWDLEPHDISWILMRNHMEVVRLPKLGEKIRVRTHPSGFERVYTYRDFRIFDESGKQIASSSTAWLLMNTKTRRLTRIPAFILQLEERLPAPETYLPRVNTKMEKEMAEVHWEKSFRVNWHDLDFNKHLNNTYYIQWMLESLPPRILEHKQLVDMQVQYQAEALLEDRVVSQCYEKEPAHFQHRLVKEEDGKELAYLSTIWR